MYVYLGETMFCCTTCGKKFKYKKELLLCEKRHNVSRVLKKKEKIYIYYNIR